MLSNFLVVVISAGHLALADCLETSPCSVSDELPRGTCLLQTQRPAPLSSKVTVEEGRLHETTEKSSKKGAVSDDSKKQLSDAYPASSTVINRLEKIVSEPVLVSAVHDTPSNATSGKSDKTAGKRAPADLLDEANTSNALASRSGKHENDHDFVGSAKKSNASKAVAGVPEEKDVDGMLAQPEEAHAYGKHEERFGIPGSRLNETLKGGVMDLTSTATQDKDSAAASGKTKQKHQHQSMHLVQQALLGAPLIFMFGSSIAVCGFFAGHQKARAELQAAAKERERSFGDNRRKSNGSMMLAHGRNSSLLESDESSPSDGGSCASLGLQRSSGRGLDLLNSAVHVSTAPHLTPVGSQGNDTSSSSSHNRKGSGFPQPEACSASKALSRWKRNPHHAAAAPILKNSLAKAKENQDIHRAFPALDLEDKEGKWEHAPVKQQENAAESCLIGAPPTVGDAEESTPQRSEVEEAGYQETVRKEANNDQGQHAQIPAQSLGTSSSVQNGEALLLSGAQEATVSSDGQCMTETQMLDSAATDSENRSE